ncbi:hypothetical protein, partial [Campylobacter sp.]|uniref:hypothetical protein n=1 Tax=Campylobacter sp. TaxID=205 RepID=UPI002A516E38
LFSAVMLVLIRKAIVFSFFYRLLSLSLFFITFGIITPRFALNGRVVRIFLRFNLLLLPGQVLRAARLFSFFSFCLALWGDKSMRANHGILADLREVYRKYS